MRRISAGNRPCSPAILAIAARTPPKHIPSLAEQYGVLPPEDPNEIDLVGECLGPPERRPPIKIFDKYIQGARRRGSN